MASLCLPVHKTYEKPQKVKPLKTLFYCSLPFAPFSDFSRNEVSSAPLKSPLQVSVGGFAFQIGATLGLLFTSTKEKVWSNHKWPLQTTAFKDSLLPASSAAKLIEFPRNSYYHIFSPSCSTQKPAQDEDSPR